MINDFTEISARGKRIKVPSVTVGDRVVIVRGGLLRMATVHQEDWMAEEPVRYAEQFLATLKKEKIDADIFSFSQRLPERSKKYGYHAEWDNVAAIPLTCYQDWWEKRLPQVARKNIKRGGKRGVVAKVVDYDDELVTGIVGIQNDSPTRQGMPFVHYGKDFAVVKGDYGSFMDTSEFIGAYFEDELIGLIKLVYMGKCASIMQILSKPTHYDKRPTNVLISKAVEVCIERGMSFLIYGKFVYGNKTSNSLTEFKARNGFERIDLPRYYVPLTFWGNVALKLKLHRGLLGLLPEKMITMLRKIRSSFVVAKLALFKPAGLIPGQSHHELRVETEAESD